jgi:hypothetical protein
VTGEAAEYYAPTIDGIAMSAMAAGPPGAVAGAGGRLIASGMRGLGTVGRLARGAVRTEESLRRPVTLLGRAQRETSRGLPTGHAMASLRQAYKELANAPSGSVARLNQQIRTITGGRVNSLLRPDVAIVRPNGRIDLIEIRSGSQTFRELRDKLIRIQQSLPLNMRGSISVREISRSSRSGGSSNRRNVTRRRP